MNIGAAAKGPALGGALAIGGRFRRESPGAMPLFRLLIPPGISPQKYLTMVVSRAELSILCIYLKFVIVAGVFGRVCHGISP